MLLLLAVRMPLILFRCGVVDWLETGMNLRWRMSRRELLPAGPPQECWGQNHAASVPPEACLPSPSRVHGRDGAGGLLPGRSLEPGGSAGAGCLGNGRESSPEPAEWASREPLGSSPGPEEWAWPGQLGSFRDGCLPEPGEWAWPGRLDSCQGGCLPGPGESAGVGVLPGSSRENFQAPGELA